MRNRRELPRLRPHSVALCAFVGGTGPVLTSSAKVAVLVTAGDRPARRLDHDCGLIDENGFGFALPLGYDAVGDDPLCSSFPSSPAVGYDPVCSSFPSPPASGFVLPPRASGMVLARRDAASSSVVASESVPPPGAAVAAVCLLEAVAAAERLPCCGRHREPCLPLRQRPATAGWAVLRTWGDGGS